MRLFLARTEERALMELTISFVSAWQATPETNVKRVRVFQLMISCLFALLLHLDFDECASYPCQNRGNCIDGIDGYKCDCVPGHTGLFCETGNPSLCFISFSFLRTDIGIGCGLDIGECTSVPCLNNGTCVDEINRFTCICERGFSGNVCETRKICITIGKPFTLWFSILDIGECGYDPCQNGGTCIDEITFFTCICLRGYSGDVCETGESAYFFLFICEIKIYVSRH